MPTLQVRNLPPDLHSKLRERARRERTSMSEVTIRALERELTVMSMDEWVAEAEKLMAGVPRREISVGAALNEARKEYDPDERFDL
jgi:plasmid stability protein